MAAVTIYTTPWCGFCARAKDLLRDKNVTFREIDVDSRPDIRVWLAERTQQRTVPQVFVNGAPLGGYTDIAALDRAGKLDTLLAAPAAAEADAALKV
ncbi:MAG: glutaredoxin 3 [Myxococcales bacterium]|nr:glutaredoxin 3 [Myxococcales bacterium]